MRRSISRSASTCRQAANSTTSSASWARNRWNGWLHRPSVAGFRPDCEDRSPSFAPWPRWFSGEGGSSKGGSGEQVEDLVFLGAGAPEKIDVRLVEMLVSVGGRQTGPAADLGQADFRVLHQGIEAPVHDFRNLAGRPMNVALLMDVSSSLGRGVRVAATSAQRFFEGVLTERDAASLLVFNHDLERLTPFTGDTRLLRYAADGLRAWGSTRLYDGIAYAVSSFAGRPDRRALVILSDGADTDSNLDFERVLAQVELAEVAIYPVALRVSDQGTIDALRTLADRTGGQYYIADFGRRPGPHLSPDRTRPSIPVPDRLRAGGRRGGRAGRAEGHPGRGTASRVDGDGSAEPVAVGPRSASGFRLRQMPARTRLARSAPAATWLVRPSSGARTTPGWRDPRHREPVRATVIGRTDCGPAHPLCGPA